MRQALLLSILLLLVTFSGCLADQGGLTGSLEKDVELPSTLYLDRDGSLVEESPTSHAVPLGWSWGEWFDGTMPPLWEGPAAPVDHVITQATITIQYRAEEDLVHSDSRPPFTIWFGAGDSIIEHAFADGPNPWPAEDVQTITFDVDSLPMGGLVVEEGVHPVLYVGSYYPDGQGQQTVSVLIGGDDASRVEWTVTPTKLPFTDRASALDASGQLQGGRCVAPLNPENSALATHTFEAPGDVVGIDAHLERTGGTGGPDLDFGLQDPSGETVAHAAGPSSPEALWLRAPNMDAISSRGTWTVELYNCQPQSSTYRVTVDLLFAA